MYSLDKQSNIWFNQNLDKHQLSCCSLSMMMCIIGLLWQVPNWGCETSPGENEDSEFKLLMLYTGSVIDGTIPRESWSLIRGDRDCPRMWMVITWPCLALLQAGIADIKRERERERSTSTSNNSKILYLKHQVKVLCNSKDELWTVRIKIWNNS